MKGVILTGGFGTRMKPFTDAGYLNKHLYPLNHKPIIDYSLETIKKTGVTDLIVVLGGGNFSQVVNYLQDGEKFGFSSVSYVYQKHPSGIAQAINLVKNFISPKESFNVILGDNIYLGNTLISNDDGAYVVLYKDDEIKLERFGVASLDRRNKIKKIEEKPIKIDTDFTNYAITGLYKFDYNYFSYFENLTPSGRGEFEVVDIIKIYLAKNKLKFTIFDGIWSDAGVFDSIDKLEDKIKGGLK